MVPSNDAPEHIERMLKRDGHDTEFVAAALARHQAAPEGQPIELSTTVKIVNWQTDRAELDLSGAPSLDELVLVKIGFEFLAVLAGTAIYGKTPHLNEIRRALKCGRTVSDAVRIERLLAPDYGPFHGICFEGNDPYVKIQVRLFGKLAYRIHFRRLALDQVKIMYTHNLKSGAERVEVPNHDKTEKRE
jgi:hypothetical protein